jgi:hypothetical protein
MTKPSYEEPGTVRQRLGYKSNASWELAQEQYPAVRLALELEAELARVRGLLQRIDDQLKRILDSPIAIINRIADILREGAESADIGKLDAADKSGKSDIGGENFSTIENNLHVGKSSECGNCGKPFTCDPLEHVNECGLGSAETGGEKAMRGYIFACNVGHEFGYRCAADPPEGIQCAIAGCNSAAVPVREDVEAGLREPEKLTGTV